MFRPILTLLAVLALSVGCGPEVPDGDEGEGEEGEGEEGEGEEGEGEEGEGEEGEEGEGEEGEGEGEGDAGGEGEGEGDVGGEGEGEGEGEGAAACTLDSDCALGFLCVDGGCGPGCRDDRDCPDDLHCDTALGDDGRCVACVGDGDCGDGEVCEASACRTACTVDDDCDGDDVCAAGVCVQCAQDADCAPGTLCTDERCVLGCRDDRDCADGQACGIEGLCVESCGADTDCPDGAVCTDDVCVLGCGGNDDRCGNDVCGPDDRCIPGCQDTDDCDANFVCDDGGCVPGVNPECRSDDECGFLSPRCNDDGVCVGCLEQADCDRGGRVCLADQQCHLSCTDGGACFGGQVCADDDSNACVDCNVDDDCDDGQACEGNACVVPVADEPLCADCEQADGPCGAGNLCVVRTIVERGFNDIRESACGVDCSDDGVCPQGFGCELVVRNGTAVGAQCVPASRVVEAQTCVAVRDARADEACVSDADCGAADVDDGACVDGVCSLPCAVDEDCFAGETCEPVIGNDRDACQ